MIADQTRSKHFEAFEELKGLATNGYTRRINIIILPPYNVGYIINPTVRFVKYKGHPEKVNKENSYSPNIPYYKNKYSIDMI